VSIENDDYKTKLVITKATRAHGGNYTLNIKNMAGEDDVTAKVTVLDKPTKPKDLKVGGNFELIHHLFSFQIPNFFASRFLIFTKKDAR